jgi:hypothetical protein
MPPLEGAGELLVALDVRDLKAGSPTWINKGSLGDFTAIGVPQAGGSYRGVPGVEFDGQADAFVGPPSVPGIEGASDRSIEIWVANPTLSADEETMISWSNRGGPDRTMMSFNCGSSMYWGAATHWGPFDLSWGGGGAPAADKWHHLAYTYDGMTERVFEDGKQRNAKGITLDTKAGFSINLAAQRNGVIQFKDEFDGRQQAGSIYIAIVRIHDGALTAAQVMANFQAESPRFQ